MPPNLTKEFVWVNGVFNSFEAISACQRAAPEQEDVSAFVASLRACAKSKDLHAGTLIHECIQRRDGLLRKCSNAVVSMYAKCGAFAKAKELLNMLKSRNVFTWTALIAGYAQNGQGHDALALFEQMLHVGVSPIAATYTCVLKACGCIGATDKGKQIHDEIATRGLLGSNMVVSNALVSMYVKCDAMEMARRVFMELPHRNVVTWNALIAGYTQHKEDAQALDCFDMMQREGLFADAVTFTCILTACGNTGALYIGEQIHEEIVKQELLLNDTTLGNAVVDMYAKCGALEKARLVLEELPVRDVISWSTLIAGYAQRGENNQAFDCFEEMQHEGVCPNPITFISILKACGSMRLVDKGQRIHDEIAKLGLLNENVVLGTAVLDMYVKCGALKKAQQVLEELPIRNVVAWSALIAGYAESGENDQAWACYERMLNEGLSPNAVTFTCILKTCGHIRSTDKGERIHTEIAKQGLLRDDVMLATALVDMHAKCGVLAKARQVLEELPVKNVASWNSLISGYVEGGDYVLALNCFEEMKGEGLPPDAVTFSCILKACGTLEAVDKGEQIHKEVMTQLLMGNSIVLGNALIDMYVKCGALKKARRVLEELPARNVISWSGIIAGYAQCGEGEHALDCFERMLQEGLSPDAVTFACILKACSSLGAAETGEKIHDEIARQGLLKNDVMLGTTLVGMYAKCGALTKAQQVLDELSFQDTGCWNALIGGYVRQGDCEKALSLFNLLLCEGLSPDATTFLGVLRACIGLSLVDDAQKFLDIMSTCFGIKPQVEHYTCLVNIYGRAGHLHKALKVVEYLPSYDKELWSTMLAACQKWGNVSVGRVAFKQQELSSTKSSQSTLLQV